MDEIGNVIFRAILSFVTLFLITKMMGKKQVSQLTLFDYVIGISIGNFAAEMTLNLDVKIVHGVVSVIIFGFISYIISFLTMKSIACRRFFMGTPVVIIDNGILLESGLKTSKLDINEFLEECRSMGYFDISEISYAIFESNGKISILPKSLYKPVTIKDMNLKTDKVSLVANVVIDGNIMSENLKYVNKNETWLLKQLKEKGKNLDDLLLVTLDDNDKLLIYEKSVKSLKDVSG